MGLALIRDGNGTRSFETLLRYRGAAMAEFWRALRTLKALQAEQAADTGPTLAARSPEARQITPAARPPLVDRAQPDEPERRAAPRLDDLMPEPVAPGGILHESAAPPWTPHEPQPAPASAPQPLRTRAPRPAKRMYGPPRFCKDDVAGFTVGANVSGLSG